PSQLTKAASPSARHRVPIPAPSSPFLAFSSSCLFAGNTHAPLAPALGPSRQACRDGNDLRRQGETVGPAPGAVGQRLKRRDQVGLCTPCAERAPERVIDVRLARIDVLLAHTTGLKALELSRVRIGNRSVIAAEFLLQPLVAPMHAWLTLLPALG